jgi:hypothetical protein
MDLPINLYFILRNKLDLLEKSQPIGSPFNTLPTQQTNKVSNPVMKLQEKPIQTETNFGKIEMPTVKQPVEADVLNEKVYNLLNDLLLEINDRASQKDVLMKIHMIILNIINNPSEPKFRSIKTSNKLYETYISKYKSSIRFLQFAGFDYSNDKGSFDFNGDINHLHAILDKLDNFLLEKSINIFNYRICPTRR